VIPSRSLLEHVDVGNLAAEVEVQEHEARALLAETATMSITSSGTEMPNFDSIPPTLPASRRRVASRSALPKRGC
jgi:hypothetical protein